MQLTLPDGITLEYEETGDGPLVLYAHGALLSRAVDDKVGFLDWARISSLSGRRFARYDARGHGASGGRPVEDDYVYRRFRDDYLEVAAHLSANRPVTGMGLSLGAATVLLAAVAAPDRFERLVLVMAPTAWQTRTPQAALYRQMADVVETQGVAGLATEGAPLPPPPPSLEGLPGYPLQEVGVSESLLPAVLRGMAASDLLPADEFAVITQPTLLLSLGDDPGHPLSTAERLAEVLPNVELHVASTTEDVLAFGDRIRDFLQGG